MVSFKKRVYFETDCIMGAESHPRLSILVPI